MAGLGAEAVAMGAEAEVMEVMEVAVMGGEGVAKAVVKVAASAVQVAKLGTKKVGAQTKLDYALCRRTRCSLWLWWKRTH